MNEHGLHLVCQRCGLRRPAIDMAISYIGDRRRAWCHPFDGNQPTCYMLASWNGDVYGTPTPNTETRKP